MWANVMMLDNLLGGTVGTCQAGFRDMGCELTKSKWIKMATCRHAGGGDVAWAGVGSVAAAMDRAAMAIIAMRLLRRFLLPGLFHDFL